MKSIPLKKFIPGIAWFFVVFILISLPKDDIPEVDGWWSFLNKIYFDKWVHTGIFGMLAFLFMLPFGKSSLLLKIKWQWFIAITLAVSAWGMITEFIQLFVPGRSCDVFDWMADTFGATLALLICRKWFIGKRKTETGSSEL